MFSIKKKSDKRKKGINQDALALRVAKRIIELQAGIANYLNSKTVHFSQNQKKVLLISICALFGGICLYIILQSIN